MRGEGGGAKGVQPRREGGVRIVCERVPQGQGPMGCQFSDEPFRQRLKAVVFFGLSLALKRAIGADCDDSALGRAAWLTVGPSLLILRLDRLYRRLLLGTDLTPR